MEVKITDEVKRAVERDIRENYARGGIGCEIASGHNIALAVGLSPGPLVDDMMLWHRLADLIEPNAEIETERKER